LAFDPSVFIHPSSDVSTSAELGPGTKIWHFCHVMDGARVGAECNVGQGCFIGPKVVVGSRVKIQNNVSLYEGVEIEDEVFLGPSAVFTNVKNPRAHVSRKSAFRRTLVRRGATVGANATILPGIELGEHCFIGAGAVVTRSVPAFAVMLGNPAVQVGWMSRHGERLELDAEGRGRCPVTGENYRLTGDALRIDG
jgi:UDP-2-acetamido-3-amino-2,3-dideoxy-glucuronate N-acetyltransferase